MSATLSILMGLPGSGKSTLARALAAETGALVLAPDEWMASLGIDLWDETARACIEQLQWRVGRTALAGGLGVVVEWGTWGREERLSLHADAKAVGARVELHILDLPLAVLLERITRRGQEHPPITAEQLAGWSKLIQWPDDEERALYDRVHGVEL